MKLLIFGAILAAQAGVISPPATPEARDLPNPFTLTPPAEEPDGPFKTPNLLGSEPGCLPLIQQALGEKRAPPGGRLDQQPPAQLQLAVDRHVNGCREFTFINRNVGPRSPLLDLPR